MAPRSKVLVLGSGNFGSCLADHLADSEHEILLWSRSVAVIESLNTTHKHPKYLKDHTFPASLKAVGPELPGRELLSQMDVLLFAIPTQSLRRVLCFRRRWDLLETDFVVVLTNRPILVQVHSQFDGDTPLFIFVNKGIEAGTEALTLEIIVDVCGKKIANEATFLVSLDRPVRLLLLLMCRIVGSILC
jgi:glycerol-3-phosphate dehydrogenase